MATTTAPCSARPPSSSRHPISHQHCAAILRRAARVSARAHATRAALAQRRVRFINFEFNPAKHFKFACDMRRPAALAAAAREPRGCARGWGADLSRCAAVDAAVAYLEYLDRSGFDLYLYSCVPSRGLAARAFTGTPLAALERLGHRCLTYGNYEARNAEARGRDRTTYRETDAAAAFASCLVAGRCPPGMPMAEALNSRRIEPAAFRAVCAALYSRSRPPVTRERRARAACLPPQCAPARPFL